MYNFNITIAKIHPQYLKGLLDGTKKFEIRTEPFTPHGTQGNDHTRVLFIHPTTHEPLALIDFNKAAELTINHTTENDLTAAQDLIKHIANTTNNDTTQFLTAKTIYIYARPQILATNPTDIDTYLNTYIKHILNPNQ